MMEASSKTILRALTWLLPLLSMAAAGCPVLPADTPVKEFKCRTQSSRSSYYVYLPSQYDPARRWPMVVTLHGTHGFDSAGAQAKEWRGLAEEHGFLVLAPGLMSTQGILPVGRSARLKELAKDEQRVLEAIAEVKKKYSVDEQAVMITGFSSGGYPTYYIGLRHPELFSAMATRTCNADLKIIESIPITEKVRAMPILIFFSKTGINPIYSGHNPVATQSWAAYRYLRQQKCAKARIKAVEGGHHRNPKLAFEFWRQHQPQLQAKPGG
ncbi:MAG: hypothetical protein AMJ81_08770 [Phycisphaerae bacterium SM23_33]|jgi:poly(3-hydroxybutyrate) depolymerase|nr:MAG: hypothetical protein AMJ81_08770 [Phycisphaerae bacterium SM23_33]